ncbi:hypothetical protein CSOJ01_07307 [Colletotrichum sojae]|uniref:Uncharacterized protein n=1 Tax=Colletotrichum sojae TaxID=2175907 RepID=A0A8H6J939_9PEZI|nr:hypothetical protein CSOJ01_07307 [Colletotrichum sojae]
MPTTHRERPPGLESMSHELISITLPDEHERSDAGFTRGDEENEETRSRGVQIQTSGGASGSRPPLTIKITIARPDLDGRTFFPPVISIDSEHPRVLPPSRPSNSRVQQIHPRLEREAAPPYSETDLEAPKITTGESKQDEDDDESSNSETGPFGNMPRWLEVVCGILFLASPLLFIAVIHYLMDPGQKWGR